MDAKGCFTQDKFIAGRTLREIERNLGFREGRLSAGGVVVALSQLPEKNQFRVAGYTNVSLHNFVLWAGCDPDVLKKNVMKQWQLRGPERLVKVIPTVPHDPKISLDEQYPHARGVPQWEVLVNLPCFVVANLDADLDAVYRPHA